MVHNIVKIRDICKFTPSLLVQEPLYTSFWGLLEFLVVNLYPGNLAVCRDLLVDLFAGLVNDFEKCLAGYFVLFHGLGIQIDKGHEFTFPFNH